MSLVTIRQVSQDYGISRQMLRYYEEIGLLKSRRVDDYAYRVYDEDAIRQLQQIIILRKLQIPVKQIRRILQNQDAVELIKIFKQNIDELDERITALATLKSILAQFVLELQSKTDAKLKLDLLNDITMISVANFLSFPKNKIEESISMSKLNNANASSFPLNRSKAWKKLSMEELDKASEMANEMATKNVRIVYMPPMTMASASVQDGNTEKIKDYINYVKNPAVKGKVTSRDVIKQFIDDMDLFRIKPDARVFCFHNEPKLMFGNHTIDGNGVWVSVPDEMELPPILRKVKFNGGLYAVCVGDFDIDYWTKHNNDYYWAPEGGISKPIMDEFVNPYNRHGSCLDNSYDEETETFTTDVLYPISKHPKLPNKDTADKLLTELEMLFSRGRLTEIDLTTMVKVAEKRSGHYNKNEMETQNQYKLPLKIELRAKSENNFYFNLKYSNGAVMFNWETILHTVDIKSGIWAKFEKVGILPKNEVVEIEWLIGIDGMVVKANGEVRHIGNHYDYIWELKNNPSYEPHDTVRLSVGEGNMAMIESLLITEI